MRGNDIKSWKILQIGKLENLKVEINKLKIDIEIRRFLDEEI